MRVDGVLKGAGEELAAGVAHHNPTSYVGQGHSTEVHTPEPNPPGLLGAALVFFGDPLSLEQTRRPSTFSGASGQAVVGLFAHGVSFEREIATEAVGQGRGVLRNSADHDREQTGQSAKTRRFVDQFAVERELLGWLSDAPRRSLLEGADRLLGRDQRAGEFLHELEEGLDRPDHKQAVAQEADQLADGEVAG